MATTTGTPDARTGHRPPLAALGARLAVGVPTVIAVTGNAALGWDAISWGGAILWGIIAAWASRLVTMIVVAMGMTRTDVLDLLGGMFVGAATRGQRLVGLAIHSTNGALLAIAWAYGAELVRLPTNWASGLLWGVLLWTLALVLLSSVGVLHTGLRRARQRKETAVGSLLGHAVYGIVLGACYAAWPL